MNRTNHEVMKTTARYILRTILVFMGLALLIFAQVQAKEDPSEMSADAKKIMDILENSTLYDGKMVVIEGLIETECPSGCWFILNDNTGSIYVDILPSNFVIPQKRGDDAKVYGKVIIKDGDPMIVGKMVEIGGEVYQ